MRVLDTYLSPVRLYTRSLSVKKPLIYWQIADHTLACRHLSCTAHNADCRMTFVESSANMRKWRTAMLVHTAYMKCVATLVRVQGTTWNSMLSVRVLEENDLCTNHCKCHILYVWGHWCWADIGTTLRNSSTTSHTKCVHRIIPAHDSQNMHSSSSVSSLLLSSSASVS